MTYKTRKTASQQLSGIFFVVFIHVAVVYIIASGLGQKAVQVVMGPIETKVIEEVKKQQEELPPPPPKLETPPPYVPPPDILLAAEPVAAPTTAIQTVTQVKTPPPVATPPAPDVEPRLNPRARRGVPEERDYPDTSRRLKEEGDVIISILINSDGSVGDVKVEKSSGYQRLDDAAVDFYKNKASKFLPATRAGQPVAAWKTLKVTWKLR
jgi:periplasmic protein TonB